MALFFYKGLLFEVYIVAGLGEMGVDIPLTKNAVSTFCLPFDTLGYCPICILIGTVWYQKSAF